MRNERKSFKISFLKRERKENLLALRCRFEDNIKMDLRNGIEYTHSNNLVLE
jgi:hypothetical protein